MRKPRFQFWAFLSIGFAFVHFISIVGPTILSGRKRGSTLEVRVSYLEFFCNILHLQKFLSFKQFKSTKVPSSREIGRGNLYISCSATPDILLLGITYSCKFCFGPRSIAPKMRSFGRFGNFSETFRSFVWDKT